MADIAFGMASEKFTIYFNLLTITLVILTAVLLVFTGTGETRRVRASYVGVDVCKKCHSIKSMGNQYKIWGASPHANAYVILRAGKAREIGKKVGIVNPSESGKCLRCHTTGGGRNEITKNEGVGCEACHGPGSGYFEFSNHASYLDRESAYKKAIRFGMYPILGIKGIKSRERLCKHCHKDTRPCVPKDIEEKKRQKISLSIIANLPSQLKHPLRR